MKKRSLLIAGIILCIVFGLLVVETYTRYKTVTMPGLLGKHRRLPASSHDIAYVSSWMTFDYINQLFNLPEKYLSQEMNIVDPKYPFLTLAQYARKTNGNQGLLILSTEDAIKRYMNNASSTMK